MSHIVNQDRDQIYLFTGNEPLYTAVIIYEDTVIGFNLLMSDKALGTFDSLQEVVEEVNRIFNNKDEIYAISGYSNGEFAAW